MTTLTQLSFFTRIKYMLRIYPELPIEQDNWDVFAPPDPHSTYYYIGSKPPPPGAIMIEEQRKINWRYLLSRYLGIRPGIDFREETGSYSVWIQRGDGGMK
jgi:hypothetical protein